MIICLINIHTCYNTVENYNNNFIINKPKIWVYWQLINGAIKPPEYIQLCIDIMKKNGSQYFDVELLDDKTIFKYIPNLRKDINDLPIALKTDYIRVKLLYLYGGMWIDADTIIMNNLFDVYKNLIDGSDFISFGCTGLICRKNDGYGKPSNGIMASQPYGKLITRINNTIETKLNIYYSLPADKRTKFDYFDLGKKIIWQEFAELIKYDKNYTMLHISSELDGTRDCTGKWIVPELIFDKHINYCNVNKLMVVMLANSIYCGNDEKYNWFCNLSKDQILNNRSTISLLFNEAIKYNS